MLFFYEAVCLIKIFYLDTNLKKFTGFLTATLLRGGVRDYFFLMQSLESLGMMEGIIPGLKFTK